MQLMILIMLSADNNKIMQTRTDNTVRFCQSDLIDIINDSA